MKIYAKTLITALTSANAEYIARTPKPKLNRAGMQPDIANAIKTVEA